jgi:hypothetical protein
MFMKFMDTVEIRENDNSETKLPVIKKNQKRRQRTNSKAGRESEKQPIPVLLTSLLSYPPLGQSYLRYTILCAIT